MPCTHHTFFVDEEAFPVGAAFYAAVAISYLDSMLLSQKLTPFCEFMTTYSIMAILRGREGTHFLL